MKLGTRILCDTIIFILLRIEPPPPISSKKNSRSKVTFRTNSNSLHSVTKRRQLSRLLFIITIL